MTIRPSEPCRRLMPPGRGGDFGHGAAGRIIDEQRHCEQHLGRLDELEAVFLRDGAVAQAVAVDAGHAAQQTVGQFERRHFQADEQHRNVLADGDVFGDVHRERRFAHAGPGGQDDQFAVVQAAGLVVEIAKAEIAAAGVCVPAMRASSRSIASSTTSWMRLDRRCRRGCRGSRRFSARPG